MKIISKFKDYYDHVAHLYGGGDEKIVYHRKRLGSVTRLADMLRVENVEIAATEYPSLSMPYHLADSSANNYRTQHWLIVCGKAYPLVNNPEQQDGHGVSAPRWEIFNFEKHRHLLVQREQAEPKESYVPGLESANLVELSRQVGHPVYIIKAFSGHSRKWEIIVDGNCPVLSDLGLPALYPAEQLYQDLSYFMANKMHASPDVTKPSTLTDKERILQHGFDVKKSFRHRA